MPFIDHINNYEAFDFNAYFQSITDDDVQRALNRDRLDHKDLLTLLSDRAQDHLEQMAVKAKGITHQYFGKTISLYAPIYVSDYCSNYCTYCGFNAKTGFKRTKLTIEEIELEAKAISDKVPAPPLIATITSALATIT